MSVGTMPSIVASRSRSSSIFGIDFNNKEVYGCIGFLKISSLVPYSAILPAYIT